MAKQKGNPLPRRRRGELLFDGDPANIHRGWTELIEEFDTLPPEDVELERIALEAARGSTYHKLKANEARSSLKSLFKSKDFQTNFVLGNHTLATRLETCGIKGQDARRSIVHGDYSLQKRALRILMYLDGPNGPQRALSKRRPTTRHHPYFFHSCAAWRASKRLAELRTQDGRAKEIRRIRLRLDLAGDSEAQEYFDDDFAEAIITKGKEGLKESLRQLFEHKIPIGPKTYSAIEEYLDVARGKPQDPGKDALDQRLADEAYDLCTALRDEFSVGKTASRKLAGTLLGISGRGMAKRYDHEKNDTKPKFGDIPYGESPRVSKFHLLFQWPKAKQFIRNVQAFGTN